MNSEFQRDSDSGSDVQRVPVYLMMTPGSANDLDLVCLLNEIWKRKWTVLSILAIFSSLGIAYAFLATPIYVATAVIAPTQRDGDQVNLPAGLGGLAGLAGIRLGVSNDSAQTIASLRSRVLIEDFIKAENLLPVLFSDEWDNSSGKWISEDPEEQPNIRDGVDFFVDNVRTVEEDIDTGLITVTVQWADPDVAAAWVNQLVSRANDQLRSRDLDESRERLNYLNKELQSANLLELRQAISRLIEEQIQTIMLAQAGSEYAFRVIDPPRPPNDPARPRKVLIIALAIVVGGLMGLLIALWKFAVEGRQAAVPR